MFLVEIDNDGFNSKINDSTTLHLDAAHLRRWLRQMHAQKVKSTRDYAVWFTKGDRFITVYRNKNGKKPLERK